MPKVYQAGTEKGRTGEREPGEKKAVGVYDKPARALSPGMIAAIIIAAIVILFAVYMLMRH